MADERIYGTLGGYGQQSGEYGDPLNPRTMTVYLGGPEDIARAKSSAAMLAPAAPVRSESEYGFNAQSPQAAPGPNVQSFPGLISPEAMRRATDYAVRHMGADRAVAEEQQRALAQLANNVVSPALRQTRRLADSVARLGPELQQRYAQAREYLTRPRMTENQLTSSLLQRKPMVFQPAPLTPQQLRSEILYDEPQRLTPDDMLAFRDAERRAQAYAETLATQQRAQVEQQEKAAAQRADDERAAELGRALEQTGADFLDRLRRGQVDTSGYTESMRQAPPIALDEERRTQSLIDALGQAGELTDAQLSRGAVDATMDDLRPRQFEYRQDTGLDTRPRAGILAQDLERTPLGRSIVRETPRGKALDVGQLSGANSAMIGRLNERLRKLEAK